MADRDFDPKDGEYIQIMNQFVDRLITYRLDTNEWSVLMFVIRMTWGILGRAWAQLRWKNIRKETQLPNSSLIDAMRKLKARNIIHTRENDSRIKSYKINSKVSTWVDPSEFNRSVQRPKRLNRSTDLKKPVYRPNSDRSTGLIPYKKNNIKNSFKNTPETPTPKNDIKTVPSGNELKMEHSWLDASAWDDFVKHRENIKHPLTPLAISKAINFLYKFQSYQQAIVDETILNNWRGLFPPKARTSNAGQTKYEKRLEKWKIRYDEKYRGFQDQTD